MPFFTLLPMDRFRKVLKATFADDPLGTKMGNGSLNSHGIHGNPNNNTPDNTPDNTYGYYRSPSPFHSRPPPAFVPPVATRYPNPPPNPPPGAAFHPPSNSSPAPPAGPASPQWFGNHSNSSSSCCCTGAHSPGHGPNGYATPLSTPPANGSSGGGDGGLSSLLGLGGSGDGDGDGDAVPSFLLKSAGFGSDSVEVRPASADASAAPALYVLRKHQSLLGGGSKFSLYAGTDSSESGAIASLGMDSMGSDAEIFLRSQPPMRMRRSRSCTSAGDYKVDTPHLGTLAWKSDRLGLGRALHLVDPSGRKLARYRPGTLQKQMWFYVPCDPFLLELALLSGVACAAQKKKEEKVAGRILSEVLLG